MNGRNFLNIFVLFLLFLPTVLSGQIKASMKEYIQRNEAHLSEKVYLHLDRHNYMQGDTIWFKAYAWFGYNQLPDTVSRVLYVDLLNPEDSVLMKKKLLIQNGASMGEFSLKKNIAPGRYTVRAYTRWMQNENTGEPFYQAVTINAVNQNFQVDCSPLVIKQKDGDSLQVAFRFYEMDGAGDLKNGYNHRVNYSVKIGDRKRETGETLAANTEEQVFKCKLPEIGEKDSVAVLGISIKDERLTYEKQFRIPLKEEIDLQFFPEGGKLVNGLKSKVAFKAIGTDGISRKVKGVIKDKDDKAVSRFESLHKGMGSFFFTPEAATKYFAILEYNHRQFKFPLPAALEKGSVMEVSYSRKDSSVNLTLKYNNSEAGTQKYIVGSAYGKIRFTSAIETTQDSCKVSIPVNLFPEGICRLTVLDSDFKPECERLFYADKNQRFKIEVSPDSSAYGTRSKVTLTVKATGPGGEAVPSNLSLAVVDKEQIIKEGGANSISAYKLLQSELKGNIEDADSYFKDDSCINHPAMDLLLLTQGYRRFLTGKANIGGMKFMPERSFDITGKVALRGSAGKTFDYSKLGLTLLFPSQNAFFDQTHPDSLGKFGFSVPFQYGKQLSYLKAFTATGKLSKEKIPKEKIFRGDIIIDEAPAPPHFKPPLPSPIITAPAIDYIRQLQETKKSELSKVSNGISRQVNLPEFTVKGKDKRWFTRFEDEAKKIADLDSLDPKGNKYKDIYDLLIREFGAERMRYHGFTTVLLPCNVGKWDGPPPSSFFPIYVINGKTFWAGDEGSGDDINKLMEFNNNKYWDGEISVFTNLMALEAIPVNEIKKIIVLPPSKNIVGYYSRLGEGSLSHPSIYQSMVVIETYSRQTYYRGDPEGIKTFILDGLDTSRAFYSPRYDKPSENQLYDGRATLYWNPVVMTDKNGQAKVEFYTGDRRTDMEVIVNGIKTGSGNPGEGKIVINGINKK